jgi:hypothetical protein
MWRLPQTSGYSYPRVATIRIDVHPVGENPTNTPRTLPTPVHARPAYTFYGQSLYVTTFHWLPQSWNRPLHPEEVLATKDRLAQLSSWVASLLRPCVSPGVGERGFDPIVTQLYQLTSLISPACDRYVQYLLAGGNRTVLNWHRRGLQRWRCRLATYPLSNLPNQLSPLSPNGPSGFQFNQVPAIKPKFWV